MSPWVWWVDRAAGIVLIVLLTCALVTGMWSAAPRPRSVPRFATLTLHRNLALLALALLAVHVGTAVADTYVEITWWQVALPASTGFRPLWVGLGTVVVDLVVAVVATSLVRHRLGLGAWRVVHLAVWPAWALAVTHALVLGTDLRAGPPWAVVPVVACLLAVVASGTARLVSPARSMEASR